MLSSNNILAFIVALVLSAQAMPPKANRASYTYNPDSIAQNEKILRLFLCLASGTANHLIRLKNAAKLHQESMPQSNDKQPALRIQLPDDSSEREIADRGKFEHKRQSHYSSKRNRGREEYLENMEGPYMPARRNFVSEENDERNEDLSSPRGDQDNSKPSPPSKDGCDTKCSFLTESQNEWQEPSIVAQRDEESDLSIEPIEIESRMMFNERVNNTLGHDKENSIGKATSGLVPQVETAAVPQGGPFTLNQTTNRSDLHGAITNESSTTASQQEMKINALGSSDHVQDKESGLSSNDSGAVGIMDQESSSTGQDSNATETTHQGLDRTLENQPKSMEIAGSRQDLPLVDQSRNDSLDIVNQGLEASSQLRPESQETPGSGLPSTGHHGNEIIGIASKALEATSNLQSQSLDIANTTQGLPSNGDKGNQTTGIIHDDLSKAFNFQPGTSGLTNVTQGLLSIGQHGNQVLDETHQPLETASNSQPGSSEMLDSTLALSSNGQSGNEGMDIARRKSSVVSNIEPGDLIPTGEIIGLPLNSQSKNQSAEIDEDSGLISTIQSGLSTAINATEIPTRRQGTEVAGMTRQIPEPPPNLQPGSRRRFSPPQDQGGNLRNQPSLSANANQTISAITDATKESSDSMIKSADGIGAIVQHANPTADLTSKAVGVSRRSSKLLVSSPLFRSFPDLKDEPSLTKDEPFEDEEAIVDEISESQVNDFAHKFADALRPVQSKQRVQVTFA